MIKRTDVFGGDQISADERYRLMCIESDNFDWGTHTECPTISMRSPYMFLAKSDESPYDRKTKALSFVKMSCFACSMCELGRNGVTRDDKLYHDPHVFSNMNPVRVMVIGQNPGWNEVVESAPFVGDSGKAFDAEIVKYGLAREDFYITNAVKCHTDKNARPLNKHIERCKPFLDIEINTIRPVLIITLGALAFEAVCPGVKFSDSFRKIVMSDRYDIPVFAVYHPSNRNLDDEAIFNEFKVQMRIACKLVLDMKRSNRL